MLLECGETHAHGLGNIARYLEDVDTSISYFP
jgi:hypothetical protein